jgi:hypothetical protein
MFRGLRLATLAARSVGVRAFAAPAKPAKIPFNWEDPLNLESQLNEEERSVMEQVRVFAQDRLMPRVTMAYRNEVGCACIIVYLLLAWGTQTNQRGFRPLIARSLTKWVNSVCWVPPFLDTDAVV